MADELDLKVLQSEIRSLRREIDRLDRQKLPRAGWRGSILSAFFGLIWFATFMQIFGMFGIAPSMHHFTHVYANHVEAKRSVEAGELELVNDAKQEHDRYGLVTGGSKSPEIDVRGTSIHNGSEQSITVTSKELTLRSERGTLILELNEKGEPVLRSIPSKK